MNRMKFVLLLLVITVMSCSDSGVVNVDLSKGYSEFSIQSKHEIVKEVALELSGEASCEVRVKISKQKVDTVGTGTINWTKVYPWRAGEFKVKLYSPECSDDGILKVNYAFKR